MDSDIRRRHEDRLLGGYHQELCNLGVAYPYERLVSDYAVGGFANLVIGVTAAMLVERSERGDALFTAMETNAVHHARDPDGFAALDQVVVTADA